MEEKKLRGNLIQNGGKINEKIQGKRELKVETILMEKFNDIFKSEWRQSSRK